MKTCLKCKTLKPLTDFQRHTHTRDRLRHECRGCTATYQKSKRTDYRGAALRRHALKKNFGITPAQYDQMFAEQKGRCAICKVDKSGTEHSAFLCVDHDHETGDVRGLLCHQCNTGIGMLKDDPSLLRRAVKYLLKRRD